MGPQFEIENKRLLIVEGKDERGFFGALLREMDLVQDIQVMDIGGKTMLPGSLEHLVSQDGFDDVVFLGIVRDANTNPKGTFDSICGALRKANLPCPEKPMKITGEKPSIITCVLPAPDRNGELEDLCLEAVAEDPAMECVDDYFSCLKEKEAPFPKDTELSKAKVRVFLASRDEPDKRLGEAARLDTGPGINPPLTR